MIRWQDVSLRGGSLVPVEEFSGYLGLEKIATMKLHKRFADDCLVYAGEFLNIVGVAPRYYAPTIEILKTKMNEVLQAKLTRMDLIHYRPEKEDD